MQTMLQYLFCTRWTFERNCKLMAKSCKHRSQCIFAASDKKQWSHQEKKHVPIQKILSGGADNRFFSHQHTGSTVRTSLVKQLNLRGGQYQFHYAGNLQPCDFPCGTGTPVPTPLWICAWKAPFVPEQAVVSGQPLGPLLYDFYIYS